MFKLAVIGNPIDHSKSPILHNYFGDLYNINLQYQKILVEPDQLTKTIDDFFKKDGKGLNVTLPFKKEVFKLCDKTSDNALKAQSVNTLYLKEGKLVGDNTDGIGFCNALTKQHNFNLTDKKVLILGAGGAAYGIIFPLIDQKIKKLTIANRTKSKAQDLTNYFNNFNLKIKLDCCDLAQLNDNDNDCYDLIINATDSGLKNNDILINNNLFHKNTLIYEMVYKSNTPMFSWAIANQLNYIDGLSMLIYQAQFSFLDWFGVMPNLTKQQYLNLVNLIKND